MFVRGSGSGEEYKRVDIAPYRGIVVDTNDPLKRNRVRVYVPELTNQPFDGWFDTHIEINVKSPGDNKETDTWNDVAVYEEIVNLIPWAEIMYPVLGETGNCRYYKDGRISTISDCNYEEGFRANDIDPLSMATGAYSPAYVYENETTAVGDSFTDPVDNLSVKCNPYAYSYRPSKHVNKGKGIFGVPEVGSKVWVTHFDGDLNFPIVIGTYHDYREFTLMNDTDNVDMISSTYPANFES